MVPTIYRNLFALEESVALLKLIDYSYVRGRFLYGKMVGVLVVSFRV